jgi:hypothetical protein
MKSTRPAGPPRAEPDIVRPGGGSRKGRVALVEQLRDLSDQAREAAGSDDVWLDLGGNPLRIRFAGGALKERLLPALAHLQVEPQAEAGLTLRAWDSESTGSPAPTPAWGPDDYREYGVVRGFFGDGFFTVFEWGTRALNVVDTHNREAFFWIPTAESIGAPDRGAPLRTLLNLWLSGTDVQLVHGAAVGRPEGCVLIVGRSGSGKSSSALSCLSSDLMHLSEDYCLLGSNGPPQVASLYSSAKIEPSAVARIPGLEEMVIAGPDRTYHKATLDLHASLPEKMLRTAPLRAIAIPRITGEPETRTRPCSAGTALAAVAPNTILQLPGNGAPALELLSSVVKSVPCHHLEVGTEPSLIPPAIEELLDPE